MQIKRRWQGLHWLCICIFILVLLSGCQQQAADDIVVLYTNDVHCAVDAGIGYAGLSAYKQWMEEQTPYVTLVDCGDAVQGDVIGTVSQGAYLCTASHDITDPLNHLITAPIIIEDQAWVGAKAFIGMGVTIGQGAVVGATASVYKNVEPWTVVGGNPAKFLKKRIIKE